MTPLRRKRLAIIPWGELWDEDYLDTIGVTLDHFYGALTGGWLFGYVDALDHAGIDSVIVCFSRRIDRPVRRRHTPTGATILVIPASPLYRSLRDASRSSSILGRFARALRPHLALPLVATAETLRQERVDAILCQDYEFERFDAAALLAKMLHLPLFASFQGGSEKAHGWIEQHARPWSMRRAAGFVIGSEAEIRRVEIRYGVPRARIARIFNPIDTGSCRPGDRDSARDALGLERSPLLLAWQGRIDIAVKRLDILVSAFRRVREALGPVKVELRIVGDGVDRDRFRSLVIGIEGLHWNARFVNDRSELLRGMQAADIFVSASPHEGFPSVLVEALAAGVPIVAVDASGVDEIVGRGDSAAGLIVDGADEAKLAAALEQLLRDPERRRAMARTARERATSLFSADAVGEQLARFLFHGETIASEAPTDQRPLVLRGVFPSGREGEVLHAQPGGRWALVLETENATRGTLVLLDGKILVTSYGDPTFVTALVPKWMSKSGKHVVQLIDGARRSDPVVLELFAKNRPLQPFLR